VPPDERDRTVLKVEPVKTKKLGSGSLVAQPNKSNNPIKRQADDLRWR
jgi:hypothetical protein